MAQGRPPRPRRKPVRIAPFPLSASQPGFLESTHHPCLLPGRACTFTFATGFNKGGGLFTPDGCSSLSPLLFDQSGCHERVAMHDSILILEQVFVHVKWFVVWVFMGDPRSKSGKTKKRGGYRVPPVRRRRGWVACRLGVVGGRGVPLACAPPWVPGVPGTTKVRVGRLPVGRGWWKGVPRSPAPHHGYRVSPVRRKRRWDACRLGVVGGRGVPVARAPPWVPGVPGTTKASVGHLSVRCGWWEGAPRSSSPHRGYRVSPVRRKRAWDAWRLGVVGGRPRAGPRPAPTGCVDASAVESGIRAMSRAPWAPGGASTTKASVGRLAVGCGWWETVGGSETRSCEGIAIIVLMYDGPP